MSEFQIKVVKLGPITKHPNADTLSMTDVHGGYPVICKTGVFAAGDLAVYIPVDCEVEVGRPEFSFLANKATEGWARIRALRLRGIFSMGLLVPAEELMCEGDDVREHFNVKRYVPSWEDSADGQEVQPPRNAPPCYDLEAFRAWPKALLEGEEITVTEKLHGQSGRMTVANGQFFIGTRTRWVGWTDETAVDDETGEESLVYCSPWATLVREKDLAEKLLGAPKVAGDLVFYFEVFGEGSGFSYGTQKGHFDFRVFDVLERSTRRWLDRDEMTEVCTDLDLPTVPLLYRGRYTQDLLFELAEGDSTLVADHVREGVVVRPVEERFDAEGCGRVVLKLHGQGFLLGGKKKKGKR